jgi:cytochrome P450
MLDCANTFDSDEKIIDEIASFLVAGVASLKYVTTNMLYYVQTNQAVNKKVVEELDKKIIKGQKDFNLVDLLTY